ncbi:uncharacterized protein LOC142235232 [Haematobia irritans]|uniref:uncharacterized protein LOC142235232 n=1 Tax=Haematobia irritans TaxID=7368 RepID=UPI003F4F9EF5
MSRGIALIVLLQTGFYVNGVTSSIPKNCQRDETSCIKLCCKSPAFYRVNTEICQLTLKYLNYTQEFQMHGFNGNYRYLSFWIRIWHDIGVPCLNSEDIEYTREKSNLKTSQQPSNIPDYCFVHQYNTQSDHYDMIPLHCPSEYSWFKYARYAIITALISMLLLILLICIYCSVEELRRNIRLRIFMWYLSSLFMAHASLIIFANLVWIYFDRSQAGVIFLGCFAEYTYFAIFLCINVICFEVWINFKNLCTDNSQRSESIRYRIYAVYVWSLPFVVYILDALANDITWSIRFISLVFIINFVTFSTLACHIVKIRLEVAAVRTEGHVLRRTAKTVCSLFFMMGMPRIVFFLVYRTFKEMHYVVLLYTFLTIEAPLIFKLFVLKDEVWTLMRGRLFPCVQVPLQPPEEEEA